MGVRGRSVAEIDSGPGPALLMPVTKTGERYISHPEEGRKKAGDKPLAIDNYSTLLYRVPYKLRLGRAQTTLGTRRYLRPDR